MWKKLLTHKPALSLVTALFLIFSYAPFDLNFLGFGFPLFLLVLFFRCENTRQAFWYGYLVSVWLMIGGFYWVVYVIHVFGHLPWIVAFILFLGFCGIGALNLPLFFATLFWVHQKLQKSFSHKTWSTLWFTLGIAALFTIFEFAIPKLFPWEVGHSLYRYSILTQVSDITGCIYLTFAMFSLAGPLSCVLSKQKHLVHGWALAIPGVLWLFIIVYGVKVLNQPEPKSRSLKVAMIQANIGSLEKLQAQQGVYSKVRYVMDKYLSLSEKALTQNSNIDLIVWPETALPFQLEGKSILAKEILDNVKKWNVPLITGAYAQSSFRFDFDYNAAFLAQPKGDGEISLQMYPKNVLLAFGEYMPLGEAFPILYSWFPAVSHFELGKNQVAFELLQDLRLGMTICYEAIIPSFVRKVAKLKTNVLVNITNDSWFGPTSEPRQHAQLSIFRAIEHRVPMIRVTNTGISFVVDSKGRMSDTTGVYEEAVSVQTVSVPVESPRTAYLAYGDWFIGLCVLIVVSLVAIGWKRYR